MQEWKSLPYVLSNDLLSGVGDVKVNKIRKQRHFWWFLEREKWEFLVSALLLPRLPHPLLLLLLVQAYSYSPSDWLGFGSGLFPLLLRRPLPLLSSLACVALAFSLSRTLRLGLGLLGVMGAEGAEQWWGSRVRVSDMGVDLSLIHISEPRD